MLRNILFTAKTFENMIINITRSLFAVLVGVLLIILKDSAMPFLVRLLGLAFLFPALVSVINLFMTRKGAALFPLVMISIIDVGSIAFGVWLLVSPMTFLGLLAVILAVVLLGFSLFQIYSVVSVRRSLRSAWGLLVTPLLLAVASIVVLANPFGTIATVSVILGACAVVAGLSDIVIYLIARKSVVEDVTDITSAE